MEDDISPSLKAELDKLEEERNCLKFQIENLGNKHALEIQDLRNSLRNSEKEIRRLMNEREGLEEINRNHTDSIDSLKQKIEIQNSRITSLENDLTKQISMFDKLYNFHSEIKKSLAITQEKLTKANHNLSGHCSKSRTPEKKIEVVVEGDSLKIDNQILKKKISNMYKEKDKLMTTMDEKTAEIGGLKQQLFTKTRRVASLKTTLSNLKQQMAKSRRQTLDLERQLVKYVNEVEKLNKQLIIACKLNDNLLQENRKLLNSIHAASGDSRDTKHRLENAKQQIEELKGQLETYVSEVKRTEDLISYKEVEIIEILCQFKSLTSSANSIETTHLSQGDFLKCHVSSP